jgi:hypothetical protein
LIAKKVTLICGCDSPSRNTLCKTITIRKWVILFDEREEKENFIEKERFLNSACLSSFAFLASLYREIDKARYLMSYFEAYIFQTISAVIQ